MKVVDLHQDFGITSQRVDVVSKSEQSSIKLLREFEDFLVFSVVFPHVGTFNERATDFSKEYGTPSRATAPLREELFEQLKFYKYLERSEGIKFIKVPKDLQSSGVKFLISLEGTDSLIDPFDLYILHDLGLRNVGLAWNYDTKFAASCMSKRDYGLTGYGEELVRIANRLGVILDLAHASKQTIIDTCNLSSHPVIVSHGNAKGVYEHSRNLDDDAIEAVVKTGGVIGITAIPSTLAKDSSINDLIKHMEYVGSNFGWSHVALGTDFLGIGSVPKGFENVTKIKDLKKMLGEHSAAVLWANSMRVIRKVMSR